MSQFSQLLPLPPQLSCNDTMIIAGPCSAENYQQVISIAQTLKMMDVGVLRAGLWKPRTHPGCFEGVGETGLEWLVRVKRETGMLVATEVASRSHVRACLDAGIDILWIGARTAANPFAVQEIADALSGHNDVTVLVKNPISPDLELWIGALQRIYNAGITRLATVHRGFVSASDTTYRNAPVWQLPIELKRRYSNLPVLVDPSHITGDRRLVTIIAQQALDMGFDGLMIEVHDNPDLALSDNEQQLTPSMLDAFIKTMKVRKGKSENDELTVLRQLIDQCDDELLTTLAHRMDIVRKIGKLKQESGIQVVQHDRFNQILEKRKSQANALHLSNRFISQLMKLIHEEAVTQQVSELSKD